MTKIFDTSTLKGLKAAERFQNSLYNRFDSVNVYAIGLNRVQIVGLKPIEELNPAKILGSAIRYLRQTHTNNYSWNLTISDEEAIELLYRKIAEIR